MGLTRLSTVNTLKPRKNTPSASSFTGLLALKTPWAKYSAADLLNNVLPDSSGNGRHAATVRVNLVTSSGNGAAVPLTVCQGFTTSTILFPDGSIPAQYTICCLCRYMNAVTARRIVSGNVNDNFSFGQYRSERGTVYDGIYVTSRTSLGTQTDWLGTCIVRGSSIPVPNNILSNGVPSGTALITNTAAGKMAVNTNRYGEYSDFEVAHILIWDQALTSTELNAVAIAFNTYLATGVLV